MYVPRGLGSIYVPQGLGSIYVPQKVWCKGNAPSFEVSSVFCRCSAGKGPEKLNSCEKGPPRAPTRRKREPKRDPKGATADQKAYKEQGVKKQKMGNASTAYVSKVVCFTERIALAPFYFSKNLKKMKKMQCAIRAVKSTVWVKKVSIYDAKGGGA